MAAVAKGSACCRRGTAGGIQVESGKNCFTTISMKPLNAPSDARSLSGTALRGLCAIACAISESAVARSPSMRRGPTSEHRTLRLRTQHPGP